MFEPKPIGTLLLVFAMCVPSALFAQIKKPVPPQQPTITVPFVGCKSDGQMGPQGAPTGKAKAVAIPAAMAKSLAYYQAEYGPGVLAPRDWYCFGTYGSNGASVYVTPTPIDSAELFSASWLGFSGPAIQLSVDEGGTSGRFEVAAIIARVFPAHKAFVTHVITEGIEPASSFPFGPYPTDKLTYKNSEVVEYLTPANTNGLGTTSRLEANNDPIRGMVHIGGVDTNLIHLSARLPQDSSGLSAAIIRQAEHEVPEM